MTRCSTFSAVVATLPISTRPGLQHLVGELLRYRPAWWPRTAASGAPGQRGHDGADVRMKPHVEHPVGLVEHEDLDRARKSQWRRCIRSISRPGVATTMSTPDALLHLQRELARGGDDEGADGPALALGPALGEAVEEREHERGRLAGARLGDAREVAAGEGGGDGNGLDRGRGRVARCEDPSHDLIREAEGVERGGHNLVVRGGPLGRYPPEGARTDGAALPHSKAQGTAARPWWAEPVTVPVGGVNEAAGPSLKPVPSRSGRSALVEASR
jgi:hypothetical protein